MTLIEMAEEVRKAMEARDKALEAFYRAPPTTELIRARERLTESRRCLAERTEQFYKLWLDNQLKAK